MRDLEFRAWDKKRGVLFKVGAIDFENKVVIPDDELFVTERCPRFEDCEIMQFTGLLDKKGKKIFEGDMLRPFRHNAKNRFMVKYSGGAFMVYNFISEYSHAFLNDCVSLVVYGNIYEHPHLLEQNNE